MSIPSVTERVAAPPPAATAIEAPTRAPATASGEPSAFSRLVRGLGREVTHGETVMREAVAAARAGADLGPAELIALQAGVYRYSEAIDLASRLVDRATSGVKTVVQGQ